jgi:ribosome maturation factor RimP
MNAAAVEMNFTEAVEKAVGPVVQAEGYELVLVEYIPRSHVVRMYIDRPGGITIDDCTTVTHLVGDLLDAEGFSDRVEGKYTLEVSSPGLDRPLVRPCDFVRFVGQKARVTTREPLAEGRRRFSGKLLQADDRGIQIDVDGRAYAIAYEIIERARLIPDF